MAYLVKPVNGEERRMERVEIDAALKNGLIAENWLVKDERQDFWYSVGKLIGTSASQTIPLVCPRCHTPIVARRIDIGLPAACSKCAYAVTVPDPDAFARNERDLVLFFEARRRAVFGGLAFVVGLVITAGSYFLVADSGGVYILWWGPIVFGFATVVSTLPRFLELRRKLGPLIEQVDAAEQSRPPVNADPRDRY